MMTGPSNCLTVSRERSQFANIWMALFVQIFVGTSSPTETSGTRIVVDSLGTTKCRYISVPMVQTRKNWSGLRYLILPVRSSMLKKAEMLCTMVHLCQMRADSSNCPATKNDWDKLMKGSPIRQDYLETVLKWKAAEEGKSIEQYMSAHAQDEDAGFLFEYYERVMNWVYSVFPKNYYRREMQQGVDWGLLYHKFHQQYYDAKEMEERVAKLMANDEVKNKKGIYTFVFDGDESSLNLRQFSASEKRVLYERCGGFCKRCGPKIHYKIEEMEADHIKPWSDGGKTELDNGQMLCKHHNRVKGNK